MCDRKLQAWKFRVDSEDHSMQATAGDDGSTLALKPTRIVNRSPKQRVSVAPQNSDLSPQKKKKKKKKNFKKLQTYQIVVMYHHSTRGQQIH